MRPVRDLQCDHAAFSNVLKELSEQSGLNIIINWPIVMKEGVSPDTEVSCVFKNARLADVLPNLVDSIHSMHWMTYYIRDGVVVITTREDVRSHGSMACFNAGPIIDKIIASEPAVEDAETSTDAHRQEILWELVYFVERTVSPAEWETNGGLTGYLEPFREKLIVRQRPPELMQLAALLQRVEHSATGGAFCIPPRNDASELNPKAGYFNVSDLLAKFIRKPKKPNAAIDPRANAKEELEISLMNAVDPQSWHDNGHGLFEEFQFVGDVIIVTQKPENLPKIKEALDELRNTMNQ